MNDRIKELAEQAKAESSQWLGSKPAITITHDELQKFAELIVRKAHEVIVVGGVDDVDDVLKHFGVKE